MVQAFIIMLLMLRLVWRHATAGVEGRANLARNEAEEVAVLRSAYLFGIAGAMWAAALATGDAAHQHSLESKESEGYSAVAS